jgi:putative membrane protein
MPDDVLDPRVYFAAERTMLAWLRTGVAIMAFGFVVARFGLFLRLVQSQPGARVSHGLSPVIGAALVGLGVVALAGGALQYKRFISRLRPAQVPATASPLFVLFLAWSVALLGVLLGAVLLA